MSEVDGLLPCPFCDGVARLHRSSYLGASAYGHCEQCDVDGPWFDANENGMESKADLLAVAAWNRRAGFAVHLQPTDEMRANAIRYLWLKSQNGGGLGVFNEGDGDCIIMCDWPLTSVSIEHRENLDAAIDAEIAALAFAEATP